MTGSQGAYLDRSAQHFKPKFVKIDSPSDADIRRILTRLKLAAAPPPS